MGFLGTEKLKELIKTKKVVEVEPNSDLSRVVCGAYELSLGSEVFISDAKDKKKHSLTQPKEQITINPGQFALLLTHEVINIPIDKIAFISIKASIKLRGLVNVSGFHVDPGFRGNLVFSVYNAGASPISLVKSEPCFLIWFANMELTEKETTSYAKGSHEHKNQDSIPVKYIDSLIKGELASPNVLLDKINTNYSSLESKINANYSSLESKINTNDEAQKGKINVVERDQKANNYVAVTAIGIVIVILVKFIFDWFTFKYGFDKGVELKQKEIAADSIINQKLEEKKALIIQIDSLQKIATAKEDSLHKVNDKLKSLKENPKDEKK